MRELLKVLTEELKREKPPSIDLHAGKKLRGLLDVLPSLPSDSPDDHALVDVEILKQWDEYRLKVIDVARELMPIFDKVNVWTQRWMDLHGLIVRAADTLVMVEMPVCACGKDAGGVSGRWKKPRCQDCYRKLGHPKSEPHPDAVRL